MTGCAAGRRGERADRADPARPLAAALRRRSRLFRLAAPRRRRDRRCGRRPGRAAARRPAVPRLPAGGRGDRGDQLQRGGRTLRVPGGRRLRRAGAPRPNRPSGAVCLACHQGEGPIFARPLWTETNANPAVAARLAPLGATLPRRAGRQTVDGLAAFDAATDRAARLRVGDRLWAEGCPEPRAGRRCSRPRSGRRSAARCARRRQPPRLRAAAARCGRRGSPSSRRTCPTATRSWPGRPDATSRPRDGSIPRRRAQPPSLWRPAGRLAGAARGSSRRSSPPATSPGSTASPPPGAGRPRPSRSTAMTVGGARFRLAAASPPRDAARGLRSTAEASRGFPARARRPAAGGSAGFRRSAAGAPPTAAASPTSRSAVPGRRSG